MSLIELYKYNKLSIIVLILIININLSSINCTKISKRIMDEIKNYEGKTTPNACAASFDYFITKTWDNQSINHDPIKITFSRSSNDDKNLIISIRAQYFGVLDLNFFLLLYLK